VIGSGDVDMSAGAGATIGARSAEVGAVLDQTSSDMIWSKRLGPSRGLRRSSEGAGVIATSGVVTACEVSSSTGVAVGVGSGIVGSGLIGAQDTTDSAHAAGISAITGDSVGATGTSTVIGATGVDVSRGATAVAGMRMLLASSSACTVGTVDSGV
jgi:hypothetical protein